LTTPVGELLPASDTRSVPVADDFAAIKSRLREIEEEKARERGQRKDES